MNAPHMVGVVMHQSGHGAGMARQVLRHFFAFITDDAITSRLDQDPPAYQM